jgi:ABC-type transport system substrate-binding protein
LGGYSNLQVDFLLQAATASGSSSQSTAFYQQAEQLLIDYTACIPFWFGEDYVLVRSYVGGYYQNALGMPVLTDVVVMPH